MTKIANSTFIRRVLPPRAVSIIDNWRFWFMIALAAAFAAIVLGYKSLERTIHDENSRETASYVSCVQSIPILKKISTHFKGTNEVIGVGNNGKGGILVQNSKAVVDVTPDGDPQLQTRKDNLARLRAGAKDVGAIRSLPVPTKAQCLEQSKHAPILPDTKTTRKS